jgi:large subunit ribosomal protein L23
MEEELILKKPVISEKSFAASRFGEYIFIVDKKATKPQIAKAVEKVFGVKVERVRTINIKGKIRRALRTRKKYQLPNFKKAIVRIAKGQKIDIFETETQPLPKEKKEIKGGKK